MGIGLVRMAQTSLFLPQPPPFFPEINSLWSVAKPQLISRVLDGLVLHNFCQCFGFNGGYFFQRSLLFLCMLQPLQFLALIQR